MDLRTRGQTDWKRLHEGDSLNLILSKSSRISTVTLPGLFSVERLIQRKKTLKAQLDHDAGVTSFDLDADSRLLVTGTKDGHLCLWDLHTRYLSSQLAAHHGRINAVLISADLRRILSCGVDNYIKVLDRGTGTEMFTKDVQDEILCLRWADSLVVSGNATGFVQVWDMDKGQILYQCQAHQDAVTSVDVGEDGRLLSGGRDKTVIVWKCGS